MHLLRSALVNADYLAHLSLEWSIDQEQSRLVEKSTPNADGTLTPQWEVVVTNSKLPLWRFLRHASPKLGAKQKQTAKRHAELRHKINAALESGDGYPWALLARIQAPKIMSDMVESLLGAIWIDSGNLDMCRAVVERMGILRHLQHILHKDVQIWHPKEELGVVADTETVRYVVKRERQKTTDGNDDDVDVEGERLGDFSCKVYIGDVEVVEERGGFSSEEIKTRAAERAVELWSGKKRDGKDVGSDSIIF